MRLLQRLHASFKGILNGVARLREEISTFPLSLLSSGTPSTCFPFASASNSRPASSWETVVLPLNRLSLAVRLRALYDALFQSRYPDTSGNGVMRCPLQNRLPSRKEYTEEQRTNRQIDKDTAHGDWQTDKRNQTKSTDVMTYTVGRLHEDDLWWPL